MLLAAPIAAASFDPVEKPSEFFLCGLAGSSLLPSALLLRVYLGWAYVGKRLLSAKVYYEEVRRARARARARVLRGATIFGPCASRPIAPTPLRPRGCSHTPARADSRRPPPSRQTGWYDGQTFVKPPEVLARDRLMGTYEVKPVLAKLRRSLAVGMATLLVSVSSLVFVPPEELAGARETPVELLKLDDTVADREAAAAYARGRPAYCEDRYDRARAGGICSNYGD